MERVGLVLEGGGMRGLYTAGVLDAFLDHDVYIPDCFAVSAGACNAASYLPKQRTRFYQATTRFLRDPRYMSVKNLVKSGSPFGTEFMFEQVANELEPIDYAGFATCGGRLRVVVTNCQTGRAEYHKIHDLWRQRDLLRASASLPLLSPVVSYGEKKLLDGGITDAVPLRFARHCGMEKNVVVLTREKGYRKKPTEALSLLKWKYREYPALIRAMQMRHIMYNRTMDLVDELEEKGEIFVLRPHAPLGLSRFTRDTDRAALAYNRGIRDASQALGALRTFLRHARE